MNSSNTKQTNVKPAYQHPETKTRCWQFKKSLEKYEQIESRGVLTHYGHAGCNLGSSVSEHAGLESQQWDPLTWGQREDAGLS